MIELIALGDRGSFFSVLNSCNFVGYMERKEVKKYLKGGIRIVKRLLILLFGNLEVGSLFLRSFKDY